MADPMIARTAYLELVFYETLNNYRVLYLLEHIYSSWIIKDANIKCQIQIYNNKLIKKYVIEEMIKDFYSDDYR